MAVTISTHNGSTVARQHNIRDRRVVSKENHINLDGVHEIWYDEDHRKAYDRIFGEAVATYNEKQKRTDRKIKSYYDEVCKDERRHPVYEMIIGVYGDDCTEENGKRIMREFIDTWEERNPNLKLVGAYYHADEDGTPHCHIDYIPIAHGYKRGMEMQAGLDRALQEQGFETLSIKKTAQIAWEQSENAYLEELCNEHGLEVEHPDKDKHVKHLKTEIFKARQEIAKLNSIIEEKDSIIKEKDSVIEEIDSKANEKLKNYKLFEEKISKETEEKNNLYNVAKSNLDMVLMAEKDAKLNIQKLLANALDKVKQEEYLYNINRDIKTIDRYIEEIEDDYDDYER